MSSWHIRPYQSDDEVGILQLYQECYDKQFTRQLWQWKVHHQPSNFHNIWVAENKGRIIGHYAGIPIQVWVNGHEYSATISVDIMVHPDFRRQGIMMMLQSLAQAHWLEVGKIFSLGLPNEQQGTGKDRLGWLALFDLTWQARLLSPDTVMLKRLRLKPYRPYSWVSRIWNYNWNRHLKIDDTLDIQLISQLDSSFDQLWKRSKAHIRFSIIRDQAWLQWRYLDAPHYKYRILVAKRDDIVMGYLVYRTETTPNGLDVAYIAELFTDPTETTISTSLLRVAIEDFQKTNIEIVMALAANDTPIYHDLHQSGFWLKRGAFDFRIMLFNQQLALSALQNPLNWSLDGDDFDVL